MQHRLLLGAAVAVAMFPACQPGTQRAENKLATCYRGAGVLHYSSATR